MGVQEGVVGKVLRVVGMIVRVPWYIYLEPLGVSILRGPSSNATGGWKWLFIRLATLTFHVMPITSLAPFTSNHAQIVQFSHQIPSLGKAYVSINDKRVQQRHILL